MYPVRKNVRLSSFDYTTPTMYFVTLCTAERRLLLGDVVGATFVPSPMGRLVERCWRQVPRHSAHVSLDVGQVMPNHLHGLLLFGAGPGGGEGPTPAGSLGAVVRSLKMATTLRARTLGLLGPGEELWQRGYHDHVVRSEEALGRIREYIHANPRMWTEDRENPARAGRPGAFDAWLEGQGRLPLPGRHSA